MRWIFFHISPKGRIRLCVTVHAAKDVVYTKIGHQQSQERK